MGGIGLEHRYLTAFYNELIIKQDYFECHEIAEEYWKSKDSFKKHDVEVFLIQVSTGEYHYRRGNFKGALKCYNKARRLLELHAYRAEDIGMTDELPKFLESRFESIQDEAAFTPPRFPLNSNMREILRAMHDVEMSDLEFDDYLKRHLITDESIIHKHLTRDRSAVIAARDKARRERMNELKNNS